MWRKLDLDQSGTLELAEVRKMFVAMGRVVDEESFTVSFSEMDKDGNGKVDSAEFIVWWQAQDPAERAALRKVCSLAYP